MATATNSKKAVETKPTETKSTETAPAKKRPSRFDWIFAAAASMGIDAAKYWPANTPTLEDISAAKKAYRVGLKAQANSVIEAMKKAGQK